MLSLADVLKVIDDKEIIEVFDVKNNITYFPRIEAMPKEWLEYKVNYIYSATNLVNDSYIFIGVEEVNNA